MELGIIEVFGLDELFEGEAEWEKRRREKRREEGSGSREILKLLLNNSNAIIIIIIGAFIYDKLKITLTGNKSDCNK